MIIVDANVAVKWFVAQDGSGVAAKLITRGDLTAPHLLISEVTNTLWRYVKADALDAAKACSAISALPRFFNSIIDDASLAPAAFDLGLKLGYPPYDFFYVALAINKDANLITADKRLINRLASSAYRDSVVHLDDWKP